MKQLIELALDRYSADRIGKFDFALENSGGSVLPASCSKTYTPALGQVSLFGFSLWHFSGSPKVIIQVSRMHACSQLLTHVYNMYMYMIVVCTIYTKLLALT